jgi:hypothetical protein
MGVEVSEKYLDGTTRLVRGVRFKNVSQRRVKFSIPRESQVFMGLSDRGEKKFANRSYEVDVLPGAVVAVPEDLASAIQSCWCLLCQKPWRFAQHDTPRKGAEIVCIETDHPKVVRSGAAPESLCLVGDDDRVQPLQVEPNLLPDSPTAVDADDIHRRVMTRISRGGAR